MALSLAPSSLQSSLSHSLRRTSDFVPSRNSFAQSPASFLALRRTSVVAPKAQQQFMEPAPNQQQEQPGVQGDMNPTPNSIRDSYKAAGKLKDKVALITGGDSGIGRAVAVHFAAEGAQVAFTYVSPKEDKDADKCVELIKKYNLGADPLKIRVDLGEERNCKEVVSQVVEKFGKLDILVNNAAEQHEHQTLEEISAEEWDRTFRTNIHAYFHMAKYALPHMKAGSAIINSTSVTAYKGKSTLIPYSSTKGAIVSFTRSLALNLAEKGIRVNGVAPGPIWTPLIPATFGLGDKMTEFGKQSTMGRVGDPAELGPSYVFLACDDSSYYTGQVLHPNGGSVING